MIAVRRTAVAGLSVLLILVGMGAPSRPDAAAAPAAAGDSWRIVEVKSLVGSVAGSVADVSTECPDGYAVIGGDVREMSDFDYLRIKAAFPDTTNEAFFAVVEVNPDHGSQFFSVVAYCVPAALMVNRTIEQVFYNPPGGVFGSGRAGGGATCPEGRRAIGGGAEVWDYAPVGTGFLLSNSPKPLGNGWYASATLNQSPLLVEALCLPEADMPDVTIASRTVNNTHDFYAYFVGSPSKACPDTTRVLVGGAYTALRNQFPNPADTQQGHVAQSHSQTGFWFATVGLAPGYTSTTVVLCIPDLDPPTVTMTSPAATPLSARTELTSAIDVAWSGNDAADFLASAEVRWRSAPANGSFGAWQYPPSWAAVTTGSVTHGSRELGYTYCYTVRGKDPAGNVSPWSAQRCAIRPLDDRQLVASAGWTRGSAGTHWNGTFTRTTTLGATLSRAGARFNQLGLVATKCPDCGRVRVELDGVLLATINLASATTAHRQIIALPRTAGRVGTVSIEVVTSGKEVTIDGLVVNAA